MARPGDHPEFFRLPPPPGRSRESSIVLDAEGRFVHDGTVVEHAGMARAFATWIQRHPDDGRFILSNGYDWTYFTVEDVPFFVEAVKDRAGVPWLVLSDGSEEPLDARTLRSGPTGALYLGVKNGAFEARFQRFAQLALSPWLEETPEAVALVISGLRYTVPSC
jgi:hypothetical protein